MAGTAPIVFFGDSYTQGTGAQRDHTIPAIIGHFLDIPVVNAGKPGQTAREALPRVEWDILAQHPGLAVVGFGVNEAFRGEPMDACVAAFDAIHERLRGAGVPMLAWSVRYAAYQEEWDAMLHEWGRQKGVPVVTDVLRGVLDDSELRSDDEHPNGAGYRLMAQRLLPHVQAALG